MSTIHEIRRILVGLAPTPEQAELLALVEKVMTQRLEQENATVIQRAEEMINQRHVYREEIAASAKSQAVAGVICQIEGTACSFKLSRKEGRSLARAYWRIANEIRRAHGISAVDPPKMPRRRKRA